MGQCSTKPPFVAYIKRYFLKTFQRYFAAIPRLPRVHIWVHTRGIRGNVRYVSSTEQRGTEPLDGTVTRRRTLPVSEQACVGLCGNCDTGLFSDLVGYGHNSHHFSLAHIHVHRLVLLPGALRGSQDAPFTEYVNDHPQNNAGDPEIQ